MSNSIKINTKIPGPESQRLMARKEQEVPNAIYNLTSVFIKNAHGALVTDVDGNTFIDFSGGIGVLNVGHTHSRVVETIGKQANNLTHSCFHALPYESYIDLAAKINQLTPGSKKKKTMFSNSGAEAVENAVKIARYFTKRPALLSFEHGYHGRTHLTMTLTGKVAPYSKGFGPGMPNVYHMPMPFCYRCPYDKKIETCGYYCADQILEYFAKNVDPETVAALIFEPVLGEGGFVSFPQPYIERLAAFCREHGILIIADEIQTGWGRTGKLFAIENYNLEPDIIVTAKSIAGGMPLGSITAPAEMVDVIHKGGLGGTFSGNPVSCAAGLAVVEAFENENVLEQADQIGKSVRARFSEFYEKYPIVGDVRGRGAMNAFELVLNRDTKEPAPDAVLQILSFCVQHGLIVLKAGTYANCIRTLMPLVISEEALNEGLDVLEEAVKAVNSM